MRLRLTLMFLSFGFPLGIWLAMLGYELQSAAIMFIGWGAIILLGEAER